jgi:hypothetical protein
MITAGLGLAHPPPFKTNMVTINEFTRYLENFGRLSDVKNFNGYIDNFQYIEVYSVMTFILRHKSVLLNRELKNEHHYSSVSKNGSMFRTVLIFGDINHNDKRLFRHTECIPFGAIDYDSELIINDQKCTQLELSLTTFELGEKFTITRMFGAFEPRSNNVQNIHYYVKFRETVQMFKCFDYIQINDGYWRSILKGYSGPSKSAIQMFDQLVTVDIEPLKVMYEDAQEKFHDAVETLPRKIHAELSKFGSEVTRNLKNQGGLTMVILAACLGLDYKYNSNVPSKTLCMTMGVVCAGLFGPGIVSKVSDILNHKSGITTQIGNCPDVVQKAFDFIFEYAPLPSMKKLKDYTYLITNFDRLKDGVMSILSWVFEQIDKICEFVLNRKIIPVSWYANTITCKDIVLFIDRITTFNTDLKANRIPYSMHSYYILEDLIAECIDFKMEITRSSGKSSVLESCYKQLMSIKTSFGIVDPGITGYRAEPATILLRGGAGVNKSTFLQMLLTKLFHDNKSKEANVMNYVPKIKQSSNSRKFIKEHMSEFAFFHISDTEFSDGYKQQVAFVMDEFGQKRDTTANPNNDYMVLINAKNTIPYHLHMADLTDKKDTYFHSKYVLATTNLMEFKPESLVSKEALDRRFDIDLIVGPAQHLCDDVTKSFTERRFSKVKLGVEEFQSVDFVPEMFEIRIKEKKSDGSVFYVPTNFENVYKRLVEFQAFHEKCFEANQEAAVKTVKASANAVYETFNLPYQGDFGVQIKNMRISKVEEDIPECYPHIRKFMHSIAQRYGSLNISYFDFFADLGKKLGKEFVDDVCMGENLKHWMPRAELEIPMIALNLDDSLTEINREISIDSSYAKDLKNIILNNKTYLGSATLIITAFTMYNMWTKEDEKVIQSSTMVKPSNVTFAKSLNELQQSYSVPVVSQMGDPDNCGRQQIDSVLRRNCAAIIDHNIQRGMITFVCSNIAIMPSHFLFCYEKWLRDPEIDFEDDTLITIRRNQTYHQDHTQWTVTVKDLINGIIPCEELEKVDVVAIRFPEHFPKVKNIVKFFKCRDSFKRDYNLVSLDIAFWRKDTFEFQQQQSKAWVERAIMVDWGNEDRKCLLAYGMFMRTNVGHCGAICSEINPKTTQRIIGIHIAGDVSTMKAHTAPVCREALESVVSLSNSCHKLIYDAVEESIEFPLNRSVMDNKFDVVKPGKPVAQMAVTTWTRSKMCGVFQEPTMFPAILHNIYRDGNLINVKELALRPYNRSSGIYIQPDIINRAIASEIDFYNSNSPFNVTPRILETEEAIGGIDDEMDFSPLSRRTSPGYPYVHERNGTQGKHAWFGKDGDYDFTNFKAIEFLQELEILENQMAIGIVPEFVFIDNLKDELRKKSKIDTCSTRNFSACPMSLVVLGKKYFGSFITWFIKNRIHNGSTLGINVYCSEWHVLAVDLLKHNTIINAGDFKGFDTSHVPMLDLALLDVVESFYKDSTTRDIIIRRCLWSTLIRSYHLIDDVIVGWDSSLCSGHFLTAIINTMYNHLVHKLCYYEIFGKYDNLFWEFNVNVKLFTNGDDSLMAVYPQFADKYNEITLSTAMNSLGLVYTPETKEVLDGHQRTIFEVSYLKRKFRFENRIGGFLAPMDLSRVKEMVNWTRKIDGDLILRDKCKTVVREFVLHGDEIARPLIDTLNIWHRRVFGVGLETTNFEKLLVEVCNSSVVPDISNIQMDITMKNDDYYNENMTIEKKVRFEDKALIAKKADNQPITIMLSKFADITVDSSYQMNAEVAGNSDGTKDVVIDNDAPIDDRVIPLTKKFNLFDSIFDNADPLDDVKRFLARPVKILAGNFASTDTASTFGDQGWHQPISGNAPSVDKIKNIYGISATLVLTLEVNANPMQQGLYYLFFLYGGGTTTSSNQFTNWKLLHRANKYQISQLPNAILNVGCETSVTLRVPWKSGRLAYLYNVTDPGYTSPGTFSIYPMVPLATNGGSTLAAYTLWGHYEDVQLGAPTQPQMGGSAPKKMLRGKIGDTLAAEQDEKPVSKYLTLASEVTGALSTVPLLNAFAGPLSWVLEASASAAKAWGFSKPNVVTHPMRMVRSLMPYMAVADVGDASEPLSIMAGNHVNYAGVELGSEVDEMSIPYLVQIPSLVTIGSWSTGNAADAAVFAVNIHPRCQVQTITDGAVSLIQHGPMSMVGSFFEGWRGSIILNVKFVKTKFHSGRLLLMFQLNDPFTNTFTPTINGSFNLMRTIVDIREMDEVELTVPYISTFPWANEQNIIGVVTAVVLDVLSAPAVVPSTIQVVVTARGGPDMAFGLPSSNARVPCVQSAYQMDMQCLYKSDVIGKGKVDDVTIEVEAATTGEHISSMRQLLKRYSPIAFTKDPNVNNRNMVLNPFYTYIFRSNAVTVTGLTTVVSRDMFTHLQSWYALSRGGVRISMIPNSTNTTQTLMSCLSHDFQALSTSAIYTYTAIAVDATAQFIYRCACAGFAYSTISNPDSGVFIPQNTLTLNRISPMNTLDSATAVSSTLFNNDNSVLTVLQTGGSVVDHTIFRAGADDCSFGCFTSIPTYYADALPA